MNTFFFNEVNFGLGTVIFKLFHNLFTNYLSMKVIYPITVTLCLFTFLRIQI